MFYASRLDNLTLGRKEAVLQSSEYYVHDSEVQNVLALRIARRFDGQGLTEYY